MLSSTKHNKLSMLYNTYKADGPDIVSNVFYLINY